MPTPQIATPLTAALQPLADAVLGGIGGRTTRLVVELPGGEHRRTTLDALAAVTAEAGARLVVVRGRVGDSDLAYSSLLSLIEDLDEHVAELPAEEAASLRAAAALREGDVDPRAARTGLRRLLVGATAARPLVLVVDGAELVDDASSTLLAFALARIDDARLASIAIVAPGTTDHRLAHGADEALTLGPSDASERGPTPIAEAPEDADDRIATTVAALPTSHVLGLAVVTADATSDLAVVTSASTALTGSRTAFDELVEGGLVRVRGVAVALAHPAVGGTAYHRLSPAERRRVHHALATAMTDPRYAEARTWQLAAAAEGHDDDVAAALDTIAGGARRQGRLATAAIASAQAADLTSEEAERLGRTIAALGAWTGQGDVAALGRALDAPFHDGVALRVARSAAMRWLHGEAAAVTELRAAAGQATAAERPVVDALFADAAYASGQGRTAVDVAGEVLRQVDRGPAAELAGAILILNGQVEAGPYLEHETQPVGADAHSLEVRAAIRRAEVHLRYGELDRAERALPGAVDGATAWDPAEAVALRARILGLRAEPVAATRLLDAALDRLPSDSQVARAVVAREQAHARFLTADVSDAVAALDRVIPLFEQLRMARQEASARHTAGCLAWSMGRIDQGLRNLARARQLDPTGPVADLVIALVESGRAKDATAWLEAAEDGSRQATPTLDLVRARATLAADDGLIEAMLARLRDRGPALTLAEVLIDATARHHRSRRWDDVRSTAVEVARLIVPSGVAGFIPRLDRLEPTEEEPDGPATPDVLAPLTDAERRVALAVSRGLTNRAAADELYLSVKTVDSHLQRIYPKLQIRSRAELAALVNRALPAPEQRSA
ncbi:MAG: LuxR C-terminal-related transcriptional regulator [Actinomycetota bacterium]